MASSSIDQGREAFRTHHNYIQSLKVLISGATLSHTNIALISHGPIPCLDVKKNLIELTKKSLSDEAKIVRADKDYSYASTSWLPVKAYYLLFNMMVTVEYLFTLDPRSYRIGHGKCSAAFTDKLALGEICFSSPKLNVVEDDSIFAYREMPGANLRQALAPDQHARLAMKKIAQYKLEEWKRLSRISTFKAQKDKQKRKDYMRKFRLSIFEFPYHMRLRANYRDFAFIEGVSSTDTAAYFNDYLAFTIHFHRALDGLKRQIVEARTA